VNEVPTRIKGVTTWKLSQRGTRWNRNGSEDAADLRQDEKTPWSFTI